MRLAIVVGHSKKKTGAYNKQLNITEYQLNEELAFAMLQECLSRNIDYRLVYRENGYSKLPKEINATAATHCICVHHNASSNLTVNGTETLYWKNSKTSHIFAKYVNDSMVKTLNYKNRNLKPTTQGENGGHVLRNTNMLCILLEPYFMSNSSAVKERDPKKLAKAIIDGYVKYVNK